MSEKVPTYTVTIDATSDRVWPLVTFCSTGWLPPDKSHEMEGTIKVNEPMTTFEVVSHDAKEEWTNRYRLSPSGSQTVVTKEMIGPPLTGAKKATRSAIFVAFVNGAVQKGLDNLKAKVESESPAA